jgi:hypothetical protein
MQHQEQVQHPTALPVLPLALSREGLVVVIAFVLVKVGEGLGDGGSFGIFYC